MRRTLLFLFLFLIGVTGYPQKLVPAGKRGYSQTSVNTAIFRKNSIVTHNGFQYIAFYDENGYLTLGKRELGNTQWTFYLSQYKGNCKDAHNVISIMVDGEGFLHVAFNHHGSSLNYCRSLRPGSLILGNKEIMVGRDETEVTYPEFYRLTNGDLIFVYRSGGSGRGNLIMNRYEAKTKTWQRVQNVLIDGENERNAYWQLYVDNVNTIHLSWVWRETPDVATNHDLCYARSRDGGVTWEKSDGEKYRLPITAENAEYVWHIPEDSELINQTGMCADKNGNPYIATYWRDRESTVPQYRLVWFDGETWHMQQIFERKTPFTLKGGGTKRIPISRPQLVIDNERGKNNLYYIFRDEERGDKVSLASTRDLEKGIWETRDLTDFSVGAWEPTYDTELWREEHKLHLFVQHTDQGDGEKTGLLSPQPVYILEVEK
ncbi:MAG: BNR repeat-containing protein [Dysgonomonadaceae bacterium]|nr:BNR repeat-containing protein [Dysgonamonadaceae bacterium]HOT64655.1 BNR repeat-containing protein [Dysgonamonadaceae bacterium]HOV35806.1 BNR repeat-containing protein [Dysgonamonadaceae bacterium]HQG07419.1 BNR repeat-containing protein [Dysgonamonadaceae bacterium]HQI42839.1 BNR repeat-containing protein [Dysgonamonadaceae bacterium]